VLVRLFDLDDKDGEFDAVPTSQMSHQHNPALQMHDIQSGV
jgi:hypothetical protein